MKYLKLFEADIEEDEYEGNVDMNKHMLIHALETLFHSWGGDTPPGKFLTK
jgi:hypothetical protein